MVTSATKHLIEIRGDAYLCPHGRQTYVRCLECEQLARERQREDELLAVLVGLRDAVDRLIAKLDA